MDQESGSKPERGKAVTAVVEQCAFCIQLFELGHKAKLRQCCKVCGPINFIHSLFYLSTSVSTSFSSCPIFHQTLDLNSSDTSPSIPDCTGSTIICWPLRVRNETHWALITAILTFCCFGKWNTSMEKRLSGKQRENNPKTRRVRKGIMTMLKDVNLVGYPFFVCVPASSVQYNCAWRGLPKQIKQCQGTSPRAGT